MLEEMYKLGYLKYKDIILDHYNELSLSEQEAFVMIKMLDQFLEKPNMKLNEIVNLTQISKNDVQSILYKLSELGYYETYFMLSSGVEDEFYSLKPFFTKVGEILGLIKTEKVNDPQISKVISILRLKLCRDLSPNELSIVKSWLEESYTVDDIIKVIYDYSPDSIINFKAIEKQLIRYKRTNKKEPTIPVGKL